MRARSRIAWLAVVAAAACVGCAQVGGGIPNATHPFATGSESPDSNAKLVRQAIEAAIAAMPAPTPPGLALAVYFEGRTYYYYQGVRAIGGAAVDGNSIFELGSLTKSFTAIMLAAYANAKTAGVALSDHPARWIAFSGDPNRVAPHPVETTCAMPTDTPLPRSEYGTVKEMTLLELATHTSGLPYTPPPPQGFPVQRQCYSPQQLVNYIEGGTFPSPPAPWVYSNIGFGFLGYVLQGINAKATGKTTSWYAMAREQILDPLDMTHTYNWRVPRSMQSEYVTPYAFRSGEPQPALHWTWDPYPAAGVLRSTAPDMAKYLGLALRLRGPIAMRAAAATAEKAYAKNAYGNGQGLAWEYVALYAPAPSKPKPPQMIWKDGATAGCSAFIGLIFAPKGHPAGAVVLTNAAKMPVGALTRAILIPLYLHERGT